MLETKLEPITSRYKLNEYYRTYDVEVDWLVTTVNGLQRTGGHRYVGKLIDVLRQMENNLDVGLVAHITSIEGIQPPDLLLNLISCNGTVEHIIVFDLKHNRQVF